MKVTQEKILEMREVSAKIVELKARKRKLQSEHDWVVNQNSIKAIDEQLLLLENAITDFLFDYDWSDYVK